MIPLLGIPDILRRYGGELLIRQLTRDGKLLQEDKLTTIGWKPIQAVTDLPPRWMDSQGPWASKFIWAMLYLSAEPNLNTSTVLVTLAPHPEAEIIQLQVLEPTTDYDWVQMRFFLIAFDLCPYAEVQRAEEATEEKILEREALTGYLNGAEKTALLLPDTLYKLTVKYKARTRDQKWNDSQSVKKDYYFRTDDAPPTRLEPYVLGTTPSQGEAFHFYEDPVKIAFNDDTILKLIDTYGKRLKLILRSAEGKVLDEEGKPVISKSEARPMHGPYHDMLIDLIESVELPCLEGELTLPAKPPLAQPGEQVKLKPLMAYTLDLELEDKIKTGTQEEIVSEQAVTPIFRRTFSTSRYASAEALASVMSGHYVYQRTLSAPIAGLPGGVQVCVPVADIDIENAMRAAGEQVLPAASKPTIRVYWIPSGGGYYKPHAILIDSPEPLWRKRQEYGLQRVEGQDDPNFQLIEPVDQTALEITESDGYISRMFYTTGGTRTLAIISEQFAPTESGVDIHFWLHVPGSKLFNLGESEYSLLTLTFTNKAPWEQDYE